MGKKTEHLKLLTDTRAALFVFLVSVCGYVTTLCPTVPFTDGGELAAVGATLGIAHPTGYPLFTILTRFVMMISPGFSPLSIANFWATFLTASAAGLSVKVIVQLFRARILDGFRGRQEWIEVSAATIGGLGLAFSSTFWSQSAEVEVYSLHLLMVMIILYTFIRGIEETREGALSPFLMLFAFSVGVSFTNHMTTLLLAPPLLYVYGKKFGIGWRAGRIIAILLPFFLLGLSLYLYLPVRSAVSPPFDWGHPAALERFLWHITGKQYRVWMFSGWQTAKNQLSYYFANLPNEFSWGLIGVMAVGVWESLHRGRGLPVFIFLAVVSTLAYAVNYDIHDIDSYFLLSYIAGGWLLAFGSVRLLESGVRRLHVLPIMVVFVVLLGWQVRQNFNRVDQSDNYLVEDFVQNSFSSFEPNALVFTGLWDYFVSASYYYQAVEKLRPDVVVVDKNLLQDRSWYFLQLKRNHPWLIEKSKPEVEAFLSELEKFEHGEPLDYILITQRWHRLLESMVEKNLVERPVYVDGRVEPEFPQKFKRVQAGLFYRLTLEEHPFSARAGGYHFRPHNRSTPAIKDLRNYYVLMILQETSALWRQGKWPEVEKSLALARQIDPTNRTLAALSRQLQAERRD